MMLNKWWTLVVGASLALMPCKLWAQASDEGPFKGVFVNDEHKVMLNINLYEATLTAPQLEFLGPVNGYLKGRGVYGVWLITDCQTDGLRATIRLSSDTGADSQTIILEALNDSTLHYSAVNGNEIRRASGRKLVKIADEMKLKRKKAK